MLAKVKEKWSTTQSDVFGLALIFFIPRYQAVSVVNRSGACFFYTHQTSGACTGEECL